MSQPTVSIIVPTYNRASMLAQALDSVLEQDYEPIELIVLDDGSTDETPAVLADYSRRYGPERLRCERHANIGQARTVNRGFELATGEIFGELSSDDWLLPGAIRRQVEALQANPAADVVSGANHLVDEHGDITDTFVPVEHSFAEMIRSQRFSIAVGALFRRSLVDRVGGWDPGYRSCPDYEFYLRAGPSLRHVPLSEVVGAHRVHSDRLTDSTAGVEMTRERIRLLDTLFADQTVAEQLAGIRDEAYANCFVLCAAMTLGPRLNTAGQRWFVWDVLGLEHSRAALRQELWEAPRRRFRTEILMRLVELKDAIIDELRDTVQIQERTIDHLEAVLAGRGGAQAAPLQAPLPPPWWRSARALTPAPLRHRVGVYAHRVVLPRLRRTGSR